MGIIKSKALLTAFAFIAFSLSAQRNYQVDVTRVRTDGCVVISIWVEETLKAIP